MLHEFVTLHREELIRRCRLKVKSRPTPPATPAELEFGIPTFLDQLVDSLRDLLDSDLEMDRSATQHGRDLQLQGFTISQVVHDYGDVCQSITDLAFEKGAPISVDDFRRLNRCLDDAIAQAVTEYARVPASARVGAETARELVAREHERFGFFAHEVRNLVNTASIAFEVLNMGNVGVRGSTGSVLKRSLAGLGLLVDRSVEEVRLRHGLQERVRIGVSELVDNLGAAGMLEATTRGLDLRVLSGARDVQVHADRQTLSAVVVNLLQNAFKFTRPGTTVTLAVISTADRVRIAIEDECGGIQTGNIEELFRPFEQRDADRTGLGLGLAFCRWGAEVNDGEVETRNIPGHGCVFTVDLPRMIEPALAVV